MKSDTGEGNGSARDWLKAAAPNVHTVSAGELIGIRAALAAAEPDSLYLELDVRSGSSRDMLVALYRGLNVPYFGEGVDWETITPTPNGILDVLTDLEWSPASEHGLYLSLVGLGPAPQEQIQSLISVWNSAARVWNDRGVPFHLLLSAR